MRKFSFFLLLFFISLRAEAKITILACEPEWRSLAAEIVGNKAEVIMVSLATENAATIFVSRGLGNSFRTADMVFCSGNGLEDKWLMRAINGGDNVQVIADKTKLLFAADYVVKKPQVRNGTAPRVHLNPHNILTIAAEFTRRIKEIDAINAAAYQKSYESFIAKWNAAIVAWEKAAQPLKGMKVVISDDAFLELTTWLQLDVVDKIDAPTGFVAYNQRLNDIARDLKKNPVKVIMFAAYEDKKPILWLAQKTDTKVILLPFTVGGAANSGDLFSMFTTTINLLLMMRAR